MEFGKPKQVESRRKSALNPALRKLTNGEGVRGSWGWGGGHGFFTEDRGARKTSEGGGG